MFYLNRTGAPEGPLSEAHIIALIQGGSLTHASICPVGYHQWLPLSQHPPFAHALAALSARAHAPAVATEPGAPPPGYGAPAGAPPQRATLKKSRGKGGLLLLLSFVFLLLAGGAAAGVYFFFLGGRAPDIAAAVPSDTEVLVAVPNIKRLGLDALTMDFLEPAAADERKNVEDLTKSIATAFEITEDEAISLLIAADSAAIASRSKKKEGAGTAVVLGFGRAGPVDDWLASKRFRELGTLGEGGKRYQLERKAGAQPPLSDPIAYGLSNLEVRDRPALYWFSDQRLLIAGDEAFVLAMTKVFEEGEPSLSEQGSYEKVLSELGDDARILGYVDLPALMADVAASEKQVLDGYLKPHGPLSAAVRLGDAGIVLDARAKFSGARYPAQIPPAIVLDLPQRLPKETFAYAAFSSKSPLKGAEIRRMLLAELSLLSPARTAATEQKLIELERTFGTSIDALVDATGEQAVVGVAMPETFVVDPLRGEQNATSLSAFAVIKLSDEKPYRALFGKLKGELGPMVEAFEVVEDASGITLRPKSALLPFAGFARFVDGHLMLAVGSLDAIERAFKAFSSKDGTLESSVAHKSALASLPDKTQLVLYLDAGRVGSSVMDSPLVKLQLSATGVDLSKFKLRGEQRVTSALGLRIDVGSDKVWSYRAVALNAPALAAFGAAGTMLGVRNQLTPPTPPGLPPGLQLPVP